MKYHYKSIPLLFFPFLAAACGPSSTPTTLLHDTNTSVAIYANQSAGTLNRNLQGIHTGGLASGIPSTIAGLNVKTMRWVMSAYDGLHYDCNTSTLNQSGIDKFNDILDLAHADGMQVILALSYVPECISMGGLPKAPPADAAAYKQYLEVVMKTFIGDRIAAGKTPMDYLEVWNEPDIPLLLGAGTSPVGGQGFAGTLDQFVHLIFDPFVAALRAEEARSGAHVKFAVSASFNGVALREIFPTLDFLLENIFGLPADEAESFAALLQAYLANAGGLDNLLNAGGFGWPDRMIQEAQTLHFPIDAITFHEYINYPILGSADQSSEFPANLAFLAHFFSGENPYASPVPYYSLGPRYHQHYPAQEIIMDEWDMSSGIEPRSSTYEGAAFHGTALIALQYGGIDRALMDGRTPEPGSFVHAWFDQLYDTVATLYQRPGTVNESNVWLLPTVSADGKSVRVLAAQWYSLEANAPNLTVKVAITGLNTGPYQVVSTIVDKDNPDVSTPQTRTATALNGTLVVDLPLPGQAAVLMELNKD